MTITCWLSRKTECRLLKDSSSGGFTIIEALLAMLLFAISLAGGIAVYFNASQIKTMAVHKEIATELASSTMEELRRKGCDVFAAERGADPTLIEMTFTDEVDVPLSSSEENMTFDQEFVYIDPSTVPGVPFGFVPSDFRLVTITISWTESFQQDPRKVSATSYVAP